MTSSSTFSSCWTSLRARSSAMLDRSRSSSIAPLAPGEGGMQTASYYAHFPSLWQPARAWTSSLEFLRGYVIAHPSQKTRVAIAAWGCRNGLVPDETHRDHTDSNSWHAPLTTQSFLDTRHHLGVLRCPTRDDSLAHHHSLLGDKRVRPQCILGTSRLFPSTGCPQARPHVPTHHRNRRRIAPFVRVP